MVTRAARPYVASRVGPNATRPAKPGPIPSLVSALLLRRWKGEDVSLAEKPRTGSKHVTGVGCASTASELAMEPPRVTLGPALRFHALPVG